jgi:hypothetical protein
MDIPAACDNFMYNACTCAGSDPCSWVGDGYCDDICAAYDGGFVDTEDCAAAK